MTSNSSNTSTGRSSSTPSNPSELQQGKTLGEAPEYLSTPTLLLMAVACGLCAGGNYFNQPLLNSIAQGLQISEASASFTVTVAQVSYALGLLFIVPLGDMFERRRLVLVLMLIAALGQFISGFAINSEMLFIGMGTAGLFSVAAQVLVPLAAILSAPDRSGRSVGIVMSGLLTGILVARSAAGLLSSIGGWQTVYFVAGALMVLIALLLWRTLPDSRNPQKISYLATLSSMMSLLKQHPLLRTRSLLGALSFASVSSLFSTMALLLAGPEHLLNDTKIGLVGLIGLAGALMASFAGRLYDKGYGDTISKAGLVLFVLSWAMLYAGAHNLWWFLAGMLLIDLALQGMHICNQNMVYALAPQARSRINAVYMTSYFIGASAGSTLGAIAWQVQGWVAVCLLGLFLILLAALVLGYEYRFVRQMK